MEFYNRNSFVLWNNNMSQTVTLQLPDELASTAQGIARQTQRPIEAVLVEWLDRVAAELPIAQLNDEQLLALTKAEMGNRQQAHLSDLLARNREGTITATEQQQLHDLLQIYRRGLIRKAEAVRVAVERGLIPPLS
jgi:hypothetical protein